MLPESLLKHCILYIRTAAIATMVDSAIVVTTWYSKDNLRFVIKNKSENGRMCRWTTWTEEISSFYSVPSPFLLGPGKVVEIQFKKTFEFNKLRRINSSNLSYCNITVMFQLVCDESPVFSYKLTCKCMVKYEFELYLTSYIL